jgi:hypothetical protein
MIVKVMSNRSSILFVNLENDIWTVVSSPEEGQKGGVLQIKTDRIKGKNISHGI